MPQFVAAAYSAAVAWLGSAAVGAVTWGTVIKAALFAASVAYTARGNSKMKKALAAMGLDQGRTLMARDPVAPRRLIYGQVLVSGPIIFMHSSGTKNEYLHMVVVLASHEVEEIGDIYLNDDLVPLDGSNEATGKYAGHFRCLKKRGVPADAADHYLVAETGGKWTNDHKLAGCAYLGMRFKWNPDLFPNGLPTVKAVVKGKKVYDPRTGLTTYSNNAALCAGDYVMDSTFGKGVALARIRSADWIEAANIADENVVLADTTTEKRYTANGTVNADMDPNDVLADLAGAMAGAIVDTGGTWTIRSGAHRTPAVTLTDHDFIGSFTMQARQSRQQTFNRVRGVYISPQNAWAPADFPPIQNTTYKAADGGIWLDKDITLPFTTSPATAQRLAKVELERGRQQITCSVMCSLKAMQLMPGDVVAVTRDRLGWSAKQFEVVEWTFRKVGTDEAPALGIELSLRETAAGVWDWADGEETTVDLAPNTTLPDPFSVPTPSGITLASGTANANIQEDGTVFPRLKVSWTTPNNIHVEQGGKVRIEYKPTAASDWIVWGELRGDVLADYITDVEVGESTDVRIQFESNAGVRGAYSSTATHTVLGDNTALSAPSGLVATAGTGKAINLDWIDITDPRLGEYAIYRNSVNTFGSATKIAEVRASAFVDASVALSTTYYYWVTAITASEVESSPSSSATATTSAGEGIDTTPPSDPSAATLNTSGTYLTGDGTVRAFLTINVPAMPSGGVLLNVLYRRTGATGWLLADQRTAGTGTVRIDDLSPSVQYDVGCQALSSYGYGSNVVTATSSPFTTPNDSTAPAVPSGLAAVTGTGKLVSLDWNDNTEADFSEYAIYRNTTNDSGSATKIAETRASRFVDSDVTLGTTYYYWVSAIDRTENQSAKSSGVSATPSTVQVGSVDATAPSAPGAITKTADGTYTAGDGTVFAYITLSVPALPALGKYQNVLYRKTGGGGDWMVAGQLTNTGSQSFRLDDLTPAAAYDVGLQAFSAFGVPSSVTTATSSPFTAPNKTSGPAAPTGGVLSATGISPKFYVATNIHLLGTVISWNISSDPDVAFYEVKATATNGDSEVDYSWTNFEGSSAGVHQTRDARIMFYSLTGTPGHVRVRAVNRSGVASSWLYIGNANSAASTGVGNIATQNKDAIAVTGITTGNGGSQRKVLARQPIYATLSVTGGSTSETINFSLSGYGFSTRPDAGWLLSSDWDRLQIRYDLDDSSSTNAVLRLTMNDGSNLPTLGSMEVTGEFLEYD